MNKLEPFCFWCGGNPLWEFHAVPRMFYEDKQILCDSCAYMRGTGIMLFELTEQNPGCGNPTIPNCKIYYTGRWVVIDDTTAAKIFPSDKLPGVIDAHIAGLRWDHYQQAGFNRHPWRTIQ